MSRPTIEHVTRYFWLDNHDKTPGIAFMGDGRLRAHMTPREAVEVAHQIPAILDSHPELTASQQPLRAMPGPDDEMEII